MRKDGGDPGFSAAEKRALSSVLDEIIPPSSDGMLPGAGELGLASYIEQAADIRPLVVQGLAAIDDLARRRNAQGFATLSKQNKSEVLNEFASTDQGFLPILMFHAYLGYYQHGRVLQGLGLEPRPPHPKGYEMEPNDLSLLDDVRRRPKMYRHC